MDPGQFAAKTREADRARAEDGVIMSCVLRAEDTPMITAVIEELRAMVETLGGQQPVWVGRESASECHYAVRIGLPFTITPAALRKVHTMNAGAALQMYRSPITGVELYWPRWAEHRVSMAGAVGEEGALKTPCICVYVRMSYSYAPPLSTTDTTTPASPAISGGAAETSGTGCDQEDDGPVATDNGDDLPVGWVPAQQAAAAAAAANDPTMVRSSASSPRTSSLVETITTLAASILSPCFPAGSEIIASVLQPDGTEGARLLISGVSGSFPAGIVNQLEHKIQACAAQRGSTARLLFVWPSTFWNPDATEPTLCVDLQPTRIDKFAHGRDREWHDARAVNSCARARSRSRERDVSA